MVTARLTFPTGDKAVLDTSGVWTSSDPEFASELRLVQPPWVLQRALFEKPPAEARAAFIRWSQCQLKRVADACTKPAEERLYWLGYALHGVQDLAFHQGISNAEHAYRDAKLAELK